MNVKRIGIWATLFCALLMIVLITESRRPGDAVVQEMPLERVFDMDPDHILRIAIVFEGKTAEIARQTDGWTITEPAGETLREEQIESLVSSITGLVIAEDIETDPEDMVQYGLESPPFSIVVEGRDRTVTLLTGDMTPTAISIYAFIKEQNRVIQIGNYIRFAIRTFIENLY